MGWPRNLSHVNPPQEQSRSGETQLLLFMRNVPYLAMARRANLLTKESEKIVVEKTYESDLN